MIEVFHEEARSLLARYEEEAQVIVADPPYGISYLSNHYKGKNPHGPMPFDWDFQVGTFLRQAANTLREGGALYLFSRWDVYPLWSREITPPLVLANCVVWVKNNWSAGNLSGNFGNQYEVILFITKGKHRIRGHRFSNVWEYPRIPSTRLLVPAQKPTELICRAIGASSDVGDLVIDPFCGSGSTGEAALQCGRNAVLGDIDPRAIRIACSRLDVSPPTDCEADVANVGLPECPILGVKPPSPLSWGLHPEAILEALDRVYSSEYERV